MHIGRREFLASMGGLGIGLGLGAVSHWLPLAPPEVGPDWSPEREQFVPSTRLPCPAHCGVRGRGVDGNLVRVDGNPLLPVSRGGLCPKGVAGIQLLYHPGRITGPVERTGPPGSGDFRRISWDAALDRVAASLSGLRTAGKAATVAWLTGDTPGIMGELVQRFAGAYGTPHVLRESYADGSSAVIQLTQGIAAPPAFDLEGSDLVMSFGAPLSEAWWCLPQAAGARDAEGDRQPRWVQIDVRHSRTAARADEWVPIRPGAYGTLALGLAYVLLKEGFYDGEKVRRYVDGIEDWTDQQGRSVPGFRTLASRYGRTEEVSQRTGVPAEAIARLAKAFGTARRPVAVWDQTVSWRTGGLSDALAIHALNILVGALSRPGGVLTQPALPLPSLVEGAGRDGSLPELTSGNWAERVASGGSSIGAMFLYYSNPVASAPNPAEVIKALEGTPLVVSFSPFLDETSRYAHLILPDHTYLERWQDAPAPPSVPIPVWGIVQPMVPPRHETRASGDVILQLASRLGGETAAKLAWPSVEEIVHERGSALAKATRGSVLVGSFQRDELRELESRGWWLPHGLSEDEFWTRLRETGGWFDPYYDYRDWSTASQLAGGKLSVFPLATRKRIAAGAGGLAEGFLPVETDESSSAQGNDYPLRLIPYRVMTLASGGTTLMPWLLENLGVLTGDAWETWAEINPKTGHELGLNDDQVVRVESAAGSFRARLRFFAGAQPGLVNVPYGLHSAVEGWGQAEGDNPLRAVGARHDPVTGLPDWYTTRVRVVPI